MSAPSKQRALDALERRLLEAARLERPDSNARHRALLAFAGGAALGSTTVTSAAATFGSAGAAGGGTVAAASGGATAPSVTAGAVGATALGGAKVITGVSTLAGVAKMVAIGAISGVVVLGAAQRIQAPDHTPPATWHAPDVERATPRPIEQPRATPLPAGAVEPPAAATELDAPNPRDDRSLLAPSIETPIARPAPRAAKVAPPKVAAPPAATAGPTEAAPAATARAPEASSLADEVALLDRARNALVTGDPSRALAILDGYDQAKVGSTLSAEATLLRIEAWVQRGETGRAAALAAEFLRDHPKSPVADRMRSIIQGAPR
jgi:hypothetical protein